MAVTLSQVAKLETDPLKKFVLMNIIRDTPMMEVIPWVNVDSLRNIVVRWKTLPSVAFRSINEGYTASEGDTEQITESVFGFGGEINYDRVFEKVRNLVQDPKKLQTEMKVKAMSLTFNDYLINGDHATDAKGFEGLKKRVAGMPTRQSVYFAGASAAALDPTASVANGNTFFSKLEEMHYKTNRTQHNAYIGNEQMKWGLGRVARYINFSGGTAFGVQKDLFDRDIPTLWGSPFLEIGLKKDQSTEIITDSETAGDAGADATSIYSASFSEQEGLVGIQLSDIEVYDPLTGGEMESKPTKILRVEWWVGLANYGSYGIVRGRNVEGGSNWTA